MSREARTLRSLRVPVSARDPVLLVSLTSDVQRSNRAFPRTPSGFSPVSRSGTGNACGERRTRLRRDARFVPARDASNSARDCGGTCRSRDPPGQRNGREKRCPDGRTCWSAGFQRADRAWSCCVGDHRQARPIRLFEQVMRRGWSTVSRDGAPRGRSGRDSFSQVPSGIGDGGISGDCSVQ